MPKAGKKRTAANSAASSIRQTKSRKVAEKERASGRPGTKQAAAIEMVRSPGGATLAALTKATGWQPHSVRGFLAGVVRKRLKLELESAAVEGVRVYRITSVEHAAAAETKPTARKS